MRTIKHIIFSFSSIIFHATASAPLLEKLDIQGSTITATINSALSKKYLNSDTFFVEYDDAINIDGIDHSIANIPCILTIAPIVWISNKTYEIDEMDEDLYCALNSIKTVFKALFPSSSWNGNIAPKKIVSHHQRTCGTQSAVLFSGGLDAVYSALTHYADQPLLITIWGSDVTLKQDAMWDQVKTKCEQFAHTYRMHHTWCKSNFRELIADNKLAHVCPDISYWWGYTSQALNYTGLAAPICFLKGIPALFIGSSHTVECPDPYGSHPLIDNFISFAGTRVFHDGAQHHRIEKLRRIDAVCTDVQIPLPHLRVCWGNDATGGNCLNCEKCVRTMIELLIAGLNPQQFGFSPYSTTLDVSLRLHIQEILQSKSMTTLYHWQCIQDAIEKGMQKNNYTAEIFELLQWIHGKKINKKKIHNPVRQKNLAVLFQKSLDHTFTLHDLAILTTSLHNKKSIKTA